MTLVLCVDTPAAAQVVYEHEDVGGVTELVDNPSKMPDPNRRKEVMPPRPPTSPGTLRTYLSSGNRCSYAAES